MSAITWTFDDIYKDVARFAGLGTSPTGDDLTLVKDIVFRGYIKFLTSTHPRTGQLYRWSFLKKQARLTTLPDVYRYNLPPDVWHVEDQFHFASQSGYPDANKRSVDFILEQRAISDYTTYPKYFSIGYGDYDKSHIQRKQVWFYPTPDASYSLRYNYYFIPPKPENDGDYFIGGPEVSEAIRLCSLAVTEQEEDEQAGVMSMAAVNMVNQLIRADEVINVADTVGPVYGIRMEDRTGVKDYIRSIQELEEVYGIET